MSEFAKVPFLDKDAWDLPHTKGTKYPEGKGPALPADNSERVATLQKICSATSATPADIDALLKAMAVALECDTVCVSLLTSTHTIISNGSGLLQRKMSFPLGICHWSLVPQEAQTIIVEDMLEDERMCCHWLVGKCPTVRFYVASPLIAANQHRIGTLCLLDTKPRQFTPSSAAILNNFSELVIRELEAAWVESTKAEGTLLRGAQSYSQPYLIADMAHKSGRVLHMSKAAQTLTGAGVSSQGITSLDDVFLFGDEKGGLRAEFLKSSSLTCVVRGVRCQQLDKDSMAMDVLIRPADSNTVDNAALPIGIPSGTCSELEEPHSMSIFFMFIKPSGYSQKSRPHIPIKGLRLGHLLGTGAFARVYRGVLDGMPVAVKIARDVADSGDLGGTPREAALMAALHHPHIVRQIRYAVAGAARGRPSYSEQSQLPEVRLWLVMEFCDKGSLESAMAKGVFLKQRGPGDSPSTSRKPALDIIVRAAIGIAEGMAYMHQHDILHCDLSKANVLLRSCESVEHGFSVKIADFGLSRMAGDDQEPDTETGTAVYKSPESFNSGVFSKASDVYAFGVLLWELYMGRPAWDGLSTAQLAYTILVDKRTLEIPEGAPERLRELLRNILGEADLRLPFAGVVEALQGCIEAF